MHIYDLESKTAIKSYSFSENVYSASFRSDGKLMCIGFESNNVKVYPLLDEQQKDVDLENLDETENLASKPKKRPLRKFDDHLG